MSCPQAQLGAWWWRHGPRDGLQVGAGSCCGGAHPAGTSSAARRAPGVLCAVAQRGKKGEVGEPVPTLGVRPPEMCLR